MARALKKANLRPKRLLIIKNDWRSYARSAIRNVNNIPECAPKSTNSLATGKKDMILKGEAMPKNIADTTFLKENAPMYFVTVSGFICFWTK